jgi:hypothetical protein
MALTATEVAKIAHLARLALTPEEEGQVTARLNDILSLVDHLQAAEHHWRRPDGSPAGCHPTLCVKTRSLKPVIASSIRLLRRPRMPAATLSPRLLNNAHCKAFIEPERHRVTDMHHKTLAELATGLAAKDFSSVELTQHFLDRIRRA